MNTNPQNPSIAPSAIKYYTNCRGVNLVPILRNEWVKSGFSPRYSTGTAALIGAFAPFADAEGHDADKVFIGSGKTSSWWYYDDEDWNHSIQLMKDIGVNAIRVFTDMYVWNQRRDKYLEDTNNFMSLCDKHKMRVQLVLWDGISLSADAGVTPTQPYTSAESVTGVEHGLASVWREVPYRFEVSSDAAADSFYTTCAVPFVSSLVQNVSSYQSLWSIDLANEYDVPSSVHRVISATAGYVSSLVSSLNIAITAGNGAGYEVYSGVLNNGRGTGPGGTYLNYPNVLQILSGVLNVGSIHPYNNSRFMTTKFVRLAASGASQEQTGLPAMYNEGSYDDFGAYPFYGLPLWEEYNFGGLIFDGLVDFGVSKEPFRDNQGMRYWDGEFRHGQDGVVYKNYALSSGWYIRSQLMGIPVTKATSKDEGADGGFWSGTIPEHAAYNSEVVVSSNQNQWLTGLSGISYLESQAGKNPNRSMKYPPNNGHPLAQEVGYSLAFSGLPVTYFYEKLYTVSTDYVALSSYTDENAVTSLNWDRNYDMLAREAILRNVSYSITENNNYNGITSEIIGSQWDDHPVASSIRLNFSSTYFPLNLATGVQGALSPTLDRVTDKPTTLHISSLDCHATSSCYYLSDVSSNGIDWPAYDVYYDDLVEQLGNIVTIMEASGAVNPDFKPF